MTGLATLLEDFGTHPAEGAAKVYSDEVLENERLEAFDKGYRAGWDDAIKAKSEESAEFSTDFAQTLQDLSFTYHDVHAQVLSNLAPLFEQILDKILPRLARDTLGAQIADQLTSLAREIGTATVEIAVAPGYADQVMHCINEAATTLPISVSEDPSLAEGQAQLKFGRREVSVDLADVATQITEAVHAMLYDKTGRQAYG